MSASAYSSEKIHAIKKCNTTGGLNASSLTLILLTVYVIFFTLPHRG
jgi:hypothetical protein